MEIAPTLYIIPVPGIPEIRAGNELGSVLASAIRACGERLRRGDILTVAQKIVSKAEGRIVALAKMMPSTRAKALAEICGKDPRLVELILGESEEIVRCQQDVLIVRHRLGFIVANAGIDQSNVEAGDEHALLLPEDPDRSASALQAALVGEFEDGIGVVINDSFGRPWRLGTCGTAIGCAGVESLRDLRGKEDRFGRRLLTSELAVADEIAAAASLAMGQCAEGVPAVIVRGLALCNRPRPASALLRPPANNLFT
jgi:coenzyme F420-0:L-glutamate ligase/coenzyme F420-1:gamma-L-glutamate ligase